MRADAESSCPESRTDSWSQDGARNPWSAPTTELWAPTGDTAEAEDFVAATGTVTVYAGDDYAAFVVDLNDDGVYEGDETFTVTFSNAVNANLPTPATVTGTILDDELEPTISIADASADEGDELMFEVTLNRQLAIPFSWST